MQTRNWRVWAATLLTFAAIALAQSPGYGQTSPAGGAAPAAHVTVSLTVDFGDGCQKVYPALAWSKGMTAWQVLDAAQKLLHPISVEKTGSVPRDYFVTRIDDLKNEGGGATRRNWLYWLDGKPAQAGVGSQQVTAGQKILFRFALWDPKSKP